MSAKDEQPVKIYRYGLQVGNAELPKGSSADCAAISKHIEAHWGKVETVFHELCSDYVHVDVHYVKATKERPFHTLITSGMSDRPMRAPDGAEDFRYSELVISLPPEWPLDEESFKDEKNWWPIRWLKKLARFPHEYDTWFTWGHTIPNDDPPVPFAENTKFCC